MSDEEVTQEMVDQELHDCARYGELEDLKMMVDSDDTGMVNFNVVDDNGNSALHKAAANNHVEMMKYLVEHKSTYVLNSNKVGPLTWAVINKHIEAVKYLLDTFPENIDVLEKPEVGLSVLSTAYDVEAEDIVTLLLTHKSAQSLDEMAKTQVEADEGDDELGEETPRDQELEEKVSDMKL